jgi:hypothetical protein
VILGLSYQGKNRLKMFEIRVLGRIFESDRGKVTGDRRNLHNGKLHHSYLLPHVIVKEAEVGMACSMHGIDEKYVNIFGWKA